MKRLEFNFLPTMIGSLPHTDPVKACALVSRFLKDIPAWPQLPNRSYKENMFNQFTEGLPGVVVTEEKTFICQSDNFDKELQKLYTAYLANDSSGYSISDDYAIGLSCFLDKGSALKAVKGQVTGPISFGITIKDEDGKGIIFNDILADAAAKLLKLKAAWQEAELSKLNKNTIIFVDDPAMAAYGSAYLPLSKGKAIALLEEVFSGIRGIKGAHCCGNTDWSILMATSVQVLAFDAYNYSDSLTIYPDEVKSFIDRGNAIAWGIVPTDEKLIADETAYSLKDRLEETMAFFTRKGIDFNKLVRQGLLTPSCGITFASEDAAEHAFETLVKLSDIIRKRHLN